MPSSRGCSRSKTRVTPSNSGNVARAMGASSLPSGASIPAVAFAVGPSRSFSCGGSTSAPARPQFDGGTSCSTTWTFYCWAPPMRFRVSVISATSACFCSGLRPANHSTCTTTIGPVLLLRDDASAVPTQLSLLEMQTIRVCKPSQGHCGQATGCGGDKGAFVMGGGGEGGAPGKGEGGKRGTNIV